MRSTIESAAALVGLATILLLSTSIVHEYGYFLRIGSSFQTLVSTTDYFTNAVIWLPLLGFSLYGLADWNLLKESRSSRLPDFGKWRTWIWPIVGLTFLLAITLFTRWPPSESYLWFAITLFVGIWSLVWRAFLPPLENTEGGLEQVGRLAIRLGIPILAGVFVLGQWNASADLTRFSEPYIVRVKNSDEHSPKIFLRSFEKGVLLRNPVTDRIEFRRWDDISMIEKPIDKSGPPIVCKFFDLCFATDRGLTP